MCIFPARVQQFWKSFSGVWKIKIHYAFVLVLLVLYLQKAGGAVTRYETNGIPIVCQMTLLKIRSLMRSLQLPPSSLSTWLQFTCEGLVFRRLRRVCVVCGCLHKTRQWADKIVMNLTWWKTDCSKARILFKVQRRGALPNLDVFNTGKDLMRLFSVAVWGNPLPYFHFQWLLLEEEGRTSGEQEA